MSQITSRPFNQNQDLDPRCCGSVPPTLQPHTAAGGGRDGPSAHVTGGLLI